MLTRSSPTTDPQETFALVQQAEAAIRQAQRRYEELVDSLEAIVWRADAGSFRTSYVSKRAESILGYPITQWLCEPAFWEAHLHPEDRLKAVASYRRARTTNGIMRWNIVWWPPTGEKSGSTTRSMPSSKTER